MINIKSTFLKLFILVLAFGMPFVVSDKAYAQSFRTITVCSSGCNYTHINDAFENAINNDVIYLNTNEFDGMGVLSRAPNWQKKLPDGVRNLTIKGRGAGRTIWRLNSNPGGNGHMLHVEGLANVRILVKDLTFRFNANNADFVKIYDDNRGILVDFENVQFMGSNHNGLYVGGNTQSTIKNSYFEGNKIAGVSVHNSATVNIVKSKFYKNYNAAANAFNNSRLEFVKNELIENSDRYRNDNSQDKGGPALINMFDNATGSVIFNTFTNNYANLIDVSGSTSGSYVWIENNQMRNNRNFIDITISGSKIASMTRNYFDREMNGRNVMTIGGSRQVYVMNNILNASSNGGIRVLGTDNSAKFSIIGNVIFQNTNAITLEGKSNMLIKDNILSENRGVGIGRTNAGTTVHSGTIDSGYNILFANNPNFLGLGGGTGDIFLNPLFSSTSSFKLSSSSPAINNGDPNLVINGTSWGQDKNGSRTDMGAYGGPFPLGSGQLPKPQAVDDNVSLRRGTVVTINPISNDKGIGNVVFYLDPTNNVLTTVNADSTIKIYANTGFIGSLRLKYKIKDPFGSSSSAYININVTN